MIIFMDTLQKIVRIALTYLRSSCKQYAFPLTVPGPVVVTPHPSLLEISISWSPPDMPNGVIIAYEVSYRPTDSSQPVTRLNTTDLATSFILSNIEMGTDFVFSVRAYTRIGPGETTSVTVSTLIRICMISVLIMLVIILFYSPLFTVTRMVFPYLIGAIVSPRNVRAMVVSSTVISVQWDGLSPCSQVNGLIVEYRVQYTAESSVVLQSIDQTGEWNVTGAEASLTGLTPYTNYSIQVAAVNEHGNIGPYSDPINGRTAEDGKSSI